MRSPARFPLLALVLPLAACTSKVGDTLTDGQPLDSDSAVPCDVATVTEPNTYAQVADVVVQRDASNIPHIYGQNDGDVFFAQGYLEARDRLMQIDTTRRAATGRLAEVWGEGSLVSDEQARAIGFERWACPAVVALAEARPSDYALIVAFVSGFNKRVAEVQADPDLRPYGMGAGELDYTPDPLTVLDVLSMGRRITWGFSSSPEPDILYTLFKKLIPNYTDMPTFRPVDDTFTTLRPVPGGELPFEHLDEVRGDEGLVAQCPLDGGQHLLVEILADGDEDLRSGGSILHDQEPTQSARPVRSGRFDPVGRERVSR